MRKYISETVDGLSRETIYEVLTDQRRRSILSCLRDTGGALSLSDLSRRIVASEYGIEPEEVTDEQLTAVRSALRHEHLPLLAEAGLLRADGGETVRAIPEALAFFAPYLEASGGSAPDAPGAASVSD